MFHILGENGIFPDTFARKIEPAAGFRDVLVNMHAKVEMDRLDENWKAALKIWNFSLDTLFNFFVEKRTKRFNFYKPPESPDSLLNKKDCLDLFIAFLNLSIA